MRRIVYIGTKPQKGDNVADTKLVWKRGDVHEVQDDKKAEKLLQYTGIWADADKPYEFAAEVLPIKGPEPEPKVLFAPQGGQDVSPFWEPITIVVTADIFKRLQSKELAAVFLTEDEQSDFDLWRERRANLSKAREARSKKVA